MSYSMSADHGVSVDGKICSKMFDHYFDLVGAGRFGDALAMLKRANEKSREMLLPSGSYDKYRFDKVVRCDRIDWGRPADWVDIKKKRKRHAKSKKL